MNIMGSVRSFSGQPFRRVGLGARHEEWSKIASLDDQPPTDPRLVTYALAAAQRVLDSALPEWLDGVPQPQRRYFATWPGEHYQFLAALCATLRADRVVEIGTDTGLATVTMAMTAEQVTTYDIVPHAGLPWSAISSIRTAGKIEQRLCDLLEPGAYAAELPTLGEADVIFADGPKDGTFEPAVLPRLVSSLRGSGTVLVVDDIRLLPMVSVWRELQAPKLDVTSFGHWSGTGLVLL